MDIRQISQSKVVYDSVKVQKEKDQEQQKKNVDDSVELSPEALQLSRAEAKKLETINARIQSGFYFQKDVTEKVADQILRRVTSL